MSWSVNAKGTTVHELVAAVEALEIPFGQYTTPVVDEWNAQLAVAKSAVKGIAESGALGDTGVFAASLSGHAPYIHERNMPGIAGDSISIWVTRNTPTPEPTPEPPAEA